MTLQEAIRSGRPFRRPGQVFYIQADGHVLVESRTRAIHTFGPTIDDLCVDDLLADDWELEEEKLTVTLSQLETAFQELNSHGVSLQPAWDRLKEISK